MSKLINYIRRWNIWRKNCLNGPVHKLLVLFGVVKSPTMFYCLLPEEKEALKDTVFICEDNEKE